MTASTDPRLLVPLKIKGRVVECVRRAKDHNHAEPADMGDWKLKFDSQSTIMDATVSEFFAELDRRSAEQ